MTLLRAMALRAENLGPVDLHLDAGTCLCITGASGSGKSLLLRAIADLDPHAGECWLEGRARSAVDGPHWRGRVTYVPAASGWWSARVADHFGPGVDAARPMAELGLPAAAANWLIERLSTGERQRLALLRALGPDTRVLLLDEPTSGLDEANVALVEAWIGRALDTGLGAVLVTHDDGQRRRMASVHRVMRAGRLEPPA